MPDNVFSKLKPAHKKLIVYVIAFEMIALGALFLLSDQLLLSAATRFRDSGYADGAIAAYTLLVQLYPESSSSQQALMELGRMYADKKDWPQSERYCRRHLEYLEGTGQSAPVGILAAILDKQGRFAQADKFYARAESDKHVHSFEGRSSAQFGGTTICVARALRLLAAIPEKQAVDEFPWSASLMNRKNDSVYKLGQEFVMVDLRAQYVDFRKPVNGVALPGVEIEGEDMRRMMLPLGREHAIRYFDFAQQQFPWEQFAHLRENFPDKPFAGATLFPTNVRDLIPRQIFVLDRADYDKLVEVSPAKPAAHPR